MNPKSSPPSRTSELWQRFVGLFGGEAVRRKFGDAPPPEWVGVIGQLNDYQLERGMRRLLASGKAHVPALPEFRRLCVMVGDDELDPPDLPALSAPAWDGDGWLIAANKHLLAHIARQAAAGIHYASVRDRNVYPRLKDYKADAETTALTGVLVDYKNAWARDMREWDGLPAVEDQKRTWAECMARADAQINVLRPTFSRERAA